VWSKWFFPRRRLVAAQELQARRRDRGSRRERVALAADGGSGGPGYTADLVAERRGVARMRAPAHEDAARVVSTLCSATSPPPPATCLDALVDRRWMIVWVSASRFRRSSFWKRTSFPGAAS